MANKFYAVRVGRTKGIFEDWDSCKASVDGFPGAIYKSFKTIDEALVFMGYQDELVDEATPAFSESSVRVYVDGSFNVETGVYGAGVVIVGETPVEISESFKDPESAKLRNVAGEIMGARLAIEYAAAHDITELVIFHDYIGLSEWAMGRWKTNLNMTREYAEFVKSMSNKIKIQFCKVQAHSGVEYNELADKLAKQAAFSELV